MGQHTFETDCKCKECNGTGLYVGLAERDGAAVVCHTCKGTGKGHIKITYEDFEGREKREDVERVFEVNCGIVVGKGKDGELALADFGGIPYEEWLSGGGFPAGSEMRRFVCPAWHAQSTMKEQPKQEREGGWCLSDLGLRFSACRLFGCKHECWEKWDADGAEASAS
jgi:hypothetical protein